MKKNILYAACIVLVVASFVTYFTLAYQLNFEPYLYGLLKNSEMIATLLRLSLYAIPGLFLISGLYGLTFEVRNLLIGMSILAILASAYLIFIAYSNSFVLILGIVLLVCSLVYLLMSYIIFK